MKTTGIIRKIDDLGRINFPREIREKLGIQVGDPLEIYLTGDVVCLKKYSLLEDFSKEACALVDAISYFVNCPILVFDKEKVIATNACGGNYNNSKISKSLLKQIEEENCCSNFKFYPIKDNNKDVAMNSQIIYSNNEAVGAIVFLRNNRLNQTQEILIETTAKAITNLL